MFAKRKENKLFTKLTSKKKKKNVLVIKLYIDNCLLLLRTFFHFFLSFSLVSSLEGFFVQPGPEDWQCRWVLCHSLASSECSVVVSQWVCRQHDRQLKLNRLLHVARCHNKLKIQNRKLKLGVNPIKLFFVKSF